MGDEAGQKGNNGNNNKKRFATMRQRLAREMQRVFIQPLLFNPRSKLH